MMDKYDHADKLFSEFIYVRTYSRYIWEEGRRERWEETVDRYINFIFSNVHNLEKIPKKVKEKARDYILRKEICPSMRAMWSCGPNAERDNTAMYNCAAIQMDSLPAFGEVMYVLLAGAGVGISVEQKYISKLSIINKQANKPPLYFKIPDTRLGWKEAIDFGIKSWFEGRDVDFDYSDLRPAGAPLKISGGYSSGGAPLQRCLEFLRQTILDNQGSSLNSLQVTDMVCEISSSVVTGGVRRASIIVLCDPEDELMRTCKQGNFHPRRFLMNISVVYRNKPDILDFSQKFIEMAKSGSGEPGIVNLYAAKKRALKHRNKSLISLVNPCVEVALRPDGEFCNLTEVVIKPWDDFHSVEDKIKTATWLGCCQSCFTYFPHLRDTWSKNCEEERLLGVSLTGLCDNKDIITPEALRYWKKTAIKISKQAAQILDINVPASVSCIKPSGTVSCLVNSSAGMHSRFAKKYIRRVRISTHDALFKMMIDQGMPYIMDAGNHDTAVFSFPCRAPEGAFLRENETAVQQLEWYKLLVENWADMNASCTIYCRDSEWLHVLEWVIDHWDLVNGVSFFPYDNKKYKDAPYEEIDEEVYNKMIDALPEINFSLLSQYENTDTTSGNRELACAGGSCDL